MLFRDYQLSNEEINALREEELNENFFKALNHIYKRSQDPSPSKTKNKADTHTFVFVRVVDIVALSDYDDDLPVKFKRYHVSDTSNKIRMFCLIDEDTDDDDELSLKFKQTQVVDISNDILNLSLIDDDDAHLRLKFKRSHVNEKIPNVRKYSLIDEDMDEDSDEIKAKLYDILPCKF
nr:conserved oligomeric Golgi complex subunit 6 [Tanacetum cinerariifolium]